MRASAFACVGLCMAAYPAWLDAALLFIHVLFELVELM